MGRHAATQDPLHVLYVGSSADLGALRRLMEAHGAVTRSRLTPEVTVVVADSSVPASHPAVRDAGTLGIPVLEPDEVIVQFAEWRGRTEVSPPIHPAPAGRRSWPFRRSAS
ncbi:MAG: BRCT domain-containing protein [Pseudonocardiaceae bacterium]